jgi:hypothetical protein
MMLSRFMPACPVCFRTVLLLSFLLVADRGWSDAFVVTRAMTATTIAEVRVEKDEVRIELEIGIEDLAGFVNLLPDELLMRMDMEVQKPLKVRLPLFFGRDLTIRLDGGPALQGYVKSMEGRRRVKRDEITGEPLPVAEEDQEAVIFAELVYPFEGQPGTLAIKPPQLKEDKSVLTTIGFTTYHLGLPIMDFRYLGREETAVLDWDDPWYSRFRNRNLWRTYNAPVNAFLYIEPCEVRVEIIARPKDLQGWVDLGLEGLDTVPVEMQQELLTRIRDFLASRFDLTIDGEPVTPRFDRINFLRRTLRVSSVIDPPEELDVASTTFGAIFVHPTTELPQEARLTWDLFTEKSPEVRAASIDEAGPLPYRLRPDDNVLVWKNFLKHPTVPALVDVLPPPPAYLRAVGPAVWVAVALLAGLLLFRALRGRLRTRGTVVVAVGALVLGALAIFASVRSRATPEQAEQVLSALLKNVYHAFDYREENLIYDTLEQSVDGELLTQIYLDTRRGLELANQGGARVKVKRVKLVSVEPEPLRGGRGFRARCTWNVSGSVGHWGHLHTRNNQYQADLTIRLVNHRWKIAALDLIREERID